MRILLISLFIFFPGYIYSQAQLSTSSRLFLMQLEPCLNAGTKTYLHFPQDLIKSYGIIKKNGIYYASAVIVVDAEFNEKSLSDHYIYKGSRNGNILTVRFPVQNFNLLIEMQGVKYINIDRGTAPDMDFSNKDTRVDSVHNAFDFPLPLFGKDVVIAVIDWGFDYKHPNFYDDELEELRIKRVWDQYRREGPAPDGYFYGSEFKSQNEILNAEHDTSNHIGIGSHGTIVAGIAAGTGAGTVFKGIATQAELVFVSLFEGDASKIDAFNYVVDYAKSVNKPLVVNMSFGRNVGPNDGTDLPNQIIDQLSDKGIIFVGSAGNRGNNPNVTGFGGPAFHLSHQFNSDTISTIIGFGNKSSYPNMWGQTLNMWGSENSSFSFAITAYHNADSIIFATPFYSSASDLQKDTIIFVANDTIQIRFASEALNPFNNRPSIMLEVRKTGNQHLALNISSSTSKVHVWNSVRNHHDFTNYGILLSDRIGNVILDGFTAGDNQYSMGEPGGVGKSVISVAAHRPERPLADSLMFGEIARFSSNGPTTDERIKPDISAPGVNITSSFSSKDPTFGLNRATVNHNGTNYPFRSASGTSMSGPAVAGIVALMLEVNPELTVEQARSVIINTARTDHHTGNIPAEGSVVWGFGKINAIRSVMYAYQSVSDTEDVPLVYKSTIFPNPANSMVYIYLEDMDQQEINMQITDMSGRIIKTDQFLVETNEFVKKTDIHGISNGIYIVEILGVNIKERFKLIIKQ